MLISLKYYFISYRYHQKPLLLASPSTAIHLHTVLQRIIIKQNSNYIIPFLKILQRHHISQRIKFIGMPHMAIIIPSPLLSLPQTHSQVSGSLCCSSMSLLSLPGLPGTFLHAVLNSSLQTSPCTFLKHTAYYCTYACLMALIITKGRELGR